MSGSWQGIEAGRGAEVLVRDHFAVKPDECVVVSVDSATDMVAAEAVMRACVTARAQPVLMLIPQLPFQGMLADPFVPEAFAQAVAHADVWLDMTFPYLAGSSVHDQAMQAGRARYLLLGDVTAASLARLYGAVDLDRLFTVQVALDSFVTQAEGATCRVVSPNGSDFSFVLGKTVTRKQRRNEAPGTTTTPMGSGIFYPVPESVRGDIFVDAIFHERYVRLPTPMQLVVDGKIREIRNAGDQFEATDRALRRASGGDYGHVIHLTQGIHPGARATGASFIEDIRSVGANAIGLGIPWWEPGGGENHPDAVLSRQSLWVDGAPIVADGLIVGPPELARRAQELGVGRV